MVEMYYLNGVFLLIPFMEYGRGWSAKRRKQSITPGRLVTYGLVFVLGLIVAMLPNLVIKWIIHGSPLDTGYGTGWFFWTDPRLLEVGFSTEHGMFLWTPVLLATVVGPC